MKLEHRQGMRHYCEISIPDLMIELDWYTVRQTDGGVLGFKTHHRREAKILAVAHVDFLCSGNVTSNNRKTIVSSALDDRAGVYTALHMLDDYGIEADVLLTDYEESGRSTIVNIGASMLDRYNWIVQLDRRGDDAVTYGYTEIADKLAEFWKVSRGARSDISYLEDICPVSAFNLGVGYYGEHKESCFLSYKVLHKQLTRLKKFYDKYVDVPLVRDHQHVELHDVIKKVYIAPRPVFLSKPLVKLPGVGEPPKCDWCNSTSNLMRMTTFGSEICPSCWEEYGDWGGDYRVPNVKPKQIFCDGCDKELVVYTWVGEDKYCAECAQIMKMIGRIEGGE